MAALADKRKYRVLVVGSGGRIHDYIAGMLPSDSYEPILRAETGQQAKLLCRDADIVILNTPLADCSYAGLAKELAAGTLGVLVLVRAEEYDWASDQLADCGVLTMSKPVTHQNFYNSIKLLTAMSVRLSRMEQRMDDMKVVNRAKWLLIEHLHMREEDAHYYIEKQAMDARMSRRQVAESVIRTYEPKI